jgi:glycosyltransferase involved in cell wall biosynthesis
VGPISAKITPDDDVLLTGIVDEADKWDIVAGATVSISPSALESFSLVVLEAWVAERPVMVNATCDPTREHCERSGGGLWFGSYRQFEAALDRLLADQELRTTLGRCGRAYVDAHYQWPRLIRRYADFLGQVVERGRGVPGVL